MALFMDGAPTAEKAPLLSMSDVLLAPHVSHVKREACTRSMKAVVLRGQA